MPQEIESAQVSCRLLHHGVAATSSSKTVICIPHSSCIDSSEIVYASHAILNVARRTISHVGEKEEPVWTVHQCLRTDTRGSPNANSTVATYTAKRVISCVSLCRQSNLSHCKADAITVVCGFSDGTITCWHRSKNEWSERVIIDPEDIECDGRAITDIGGIVEKEKGGSTCLSIISCTSLGSFYFRHQEASVVKTTLTHTPTNAVNLQSHLSGATLILIGTAAPRHNKIHIFSHEPACKEVHYCGALAGHEDWITCFDWRTIKDGDFLASGSQDARIRLWKFSTSTIADTTSAVVKIPSSKEIESETTDDDDDDDDDDFDDKEIEEGESRLEIIHGKSQTSVTLEALLIAHEERVTSVAWHPDPQPIYGTSLILISSSMDRSILVWGELSGVWAPISRVGSAGGILGGSIGSSLLGFLNVKLEPIHGRWMMGHGYGGALHFFASDSQSTAELTHGMTLEERAALAPWKAQPCITGHFDSVTDICWETNEADYLITVGNDQTCRVWAPLIDSRIETEESETWVEIARPQVHGYNLSAVTSISSPDHPHRLVSAADEKELRVFDATTTFEVLLDRVQDRMRLREGSLDRVDRAFIPSLGLSNQAKASEGAEEDIFGASESVTQLPLERDLGAVSLWPELLKLYGHNTELVRLTSIQSPKLGGKKSTDDAKDEWLVASSAKARDVEAACIRLWDISKNRCTQVLTGGHRSTVTAMCFSPDGRFLASSGKDRRLCLWERGLSMNSMAEGVFNLNCAIDSAHKRIVWDIQFCPFEPTVLVSASRDGSMKVWKIQNCDEKQGQYSINLQMMTMFTSHHLASNGKPEAVTSLSIAPVAVEHTNGILLAVGLENGFIELWKVNPGSEGGQSCCAELALSFPRELSHVAAVTTLAWRPRRSKTENKLVLASGSEDHGCRIFEVSVS